MTAFCKFGLFFFFMTNWLFETYPSRRMCSISTVGSPSQTLVISLFSLRSEGLCTFPRSFLWLKEQPLEDTSDQQLLDKEQESDCLRGYDTSCWCIIIALLQQWKSCFLFYTMISRGISLLICLFGVLKSTAPLATIPASGQISMGSLGAHFSSGCPRKEHPLYWIN